jgi:hypothetical protein
LKLEGVEFHTTHKADKKAAFVERFNRTLKKKMYKYFNKFSTSLYLDTLSDLLDSYNRPVHSTIGMPSSKVSPTNAYSVAKGK